MKTILLVDDDATVRELLGDFLETQGYSVTTAHDGLLGLRAFREGEFDFVLSDWNMPRMNGFGMVVGIHSLKPTQKVLMMSGDHSNKPPHGVRMLEKPFKLIELAEVLSQMSKEAV